MGKLLKNYLLYLSLLSIQMASAQQVVVKNPVHFLALGDSYTIGQGVAASESWPVKLIDELKSRGADVEKLTIIAQTGWRTDDLLEAISRAQPDSNYNLVSLLIGVNNQYQGMDIDVYPLEFRALLETAVAHCGGRKEGVFVLSIPDYGYTPFGASNRKIISAEIDEYNRINQQITEDMGIVYFDITPISREAIIKPEYLAPDNLHPSGAMYSSWVDLMFNTAGFNLVPTSVSELNEARGFRVFPNPAVEHLHFSTRENSNRIVFYNSMGNMVFTKALESQKTFSVDVSKWVSGVYFFRIKNEQSNYRSGKIIIH